MIENYKTFRLHSIFLESVGNHKGYVLFVSLSLFASCLDLQWSLHFFNVHCYSSISYTLVKSCFLGYPTCESLPASWHWFASRPVNVNTSGLVDTLRHWDYARRFAKQVGRQVTAFWPCHPYDKGTLTMAHVTLKRFMIFMQKFAGAWEISLKAWKLKVFPFCYKHYKKKNPLHWASVN